MYNTATPESSRLVWFSNMDSTFQMTYDTLGNLTSDSSRVRLQWGNPFKGGSFFDKMGALNGWLAIGTDLNRHLPDGRTAGWDYDEETGKVIGPDGHEYEIGKEALAKARANPGAHFALNGDKIEKELGHPSGKDGVNIRFAGRGPGAGGLYLDVWTELKENESGPLQRFHWDAFASASPTGVLSKLENSGSRFSGFAALYFLTIF